MTHKPTPGLNTVDQAILQHLQRHGQTTVADVASALCAPLDLKKHSVTTAFYLLGERGLLAGDPTRTRDILYSLPPRGRHWLVHGRPPPTAGGKAPSAAYNIKTEPVYQPNTDAPNHRPGAMDAYALPSRVGNALLYPRGHAPAAQPGSAQ